MGQGVGQKTILTHFSVDCLVIIPIIFAVMHWGFSVPKMLKRY